MGRTRKAVFWKVPQFSHVGKCEKSRGHQEPHSFWQKKTLALGSHRDATHVEKGYKGMHNFPSMVITDQSGGDHTTDTNYEMQKQGEWPFGG